MSITRDLKFLSLVSKDLWEGLRFRSRTAHLPTITIFGSARVNESHEFYQEAKKLSFQLAKQGYAIMTGGGGAIMQAANEGAHDAGGESIGINIDISREHVLNRFVKTGMRAQYFFVRKVLLSRNSNAFIAFPGGFGTLDELFEVVTLIQTRKTADVPIILVHGEFWAGLLKWCKETLIPAGMITEKEFARLQVVDSTEAALKLIPTLKR